MKARTALWAALLSIFAAVSALAGVPPKETSPFYREMNPCKGWFCYETAPEPEADKAEPVGDLPVKAIFTGAVDWDAAWTMPPADLKELINKALSFAQENPRDESRMLTYMQLQGLAMRRAKVFQEAWAETLQKYPVLDSTVQRAPTLMGTNAEVAAEREDRSLAISSMREQMGIIYFFSPTCRYCQQQSTVLSSFAAKWNWTHITAVNILESPEIAAKYGVQAVPDLWVAGNIRGETLQRRLRAGLVEHADLERGLLKAWSVWNGGGAYERPEMSQQLQGFDEFLRATQSGKTEVRP